MGKKSIPLKKENKIKAVNMLPRSYCPTAKTASFFFFVYYLARASPPHIHILFPFLSRHCTAPEFSLSFFFRAEGTGQTNGGPESHSERNLYLSVADARRLRRRRPIGVDLPRHRLLERRPQRNVPDSALRSSLRRLLSVTLRPA